MRVRRTFAHSGPLTRLLDRLGALVRQYRERSAVEPGSLVPAGEVPPPDGGPPVARAWWRERSFLLGAAGVGGGAVLAGYLLAALVFFPAPLFAGSKTTPRLIGMQEGAAREALARDGLGVAGVERAAHPSAATGVVVWQDPPPGVVTREGAGVALTVSTGPQRIPVPEVAGYEAQDARLLLESAGLKVGSVESTQAPTPKNVAVNTRPPAGTALAPGTAVTLVVSVGAATIRVPSLIGLTLDEARLALETAGLALGTNFTQATREAAPGEIFYQEPAPGTLSAPGTSVNVRIARSGS